MKYILTIAASDNTCGAGTQKDVQVIASLNCWPLSVVTGVTVQGNGKVFSVEAVNSQLVDAQIQQCLNSFLINAVKIGALCSIENLQVVFDFLKKNDKKIPIVLDPVVKATDGTPLTPIDIEEYTHLLPYVSVITPNKSEMEMICGSPLYSINQAIDRAMSVARLYNCSLLLKGGHFSSDTINDYYIDDKQVVEFSHPRFSFSNDHGTGCTLSTALACYIAMGCTITEACMKAINYLIQFYTRYSE